MWFPNSIVRKQYVKLKVYRVVLHCQKFVFHEAPCLARFKSVTVLIAHLYEYFYTYVCLIK